jgi:hypothetical protein
MFDPIMIEALGRSIQEERRAEAERYLRFSSFKPEQRGRSLRLQLLLNLFASVRRSRTSVRPLVLTPTVQTER